jgi:hypothetical protein
MRKILIFLLIIPIFFIFIIGLVLFDYVYFPLISSKAEKAAELYIEEKYDEDFDINKSSFSKPLGDDMGTYRIESHPSKNPKLTVHIHVDEDMEPTSDDYLDVKWRADLNNDFAGVYKKLYGTVENYSYMVNVYFPEEAYTKYNISSTYQEILQQEHHNIGNIVFANVILTSSNEIDQQLTKLFELIQHLKNQELEYFSIDIEFFNEKISISAKDKKLDYNNFSNKHLDDRDYVFRFAYDSRDGESQRKLNDIKSGSDLEEYLQ